MGASGETEERFETFMGAAGQDEGFSETVVALLRADGRVSRALDEALAPAGLTGPQFNVLMLLASSGGRLALCDVAGRLLKSPPNVTGLVDRLERDGLVERVRGERDRRSVSAEITERGWEALQVGAPALFAAERRMLANLSGDERRTLTDLLGRAAAANDPA